MKVVLECGDFKLYADGVIRIGDCMMSRWDPFDKHLNGQVKTLLEYLEKRLESIGSSVALDRFHTFQIYTILKHYTGDLGDASAYRRKYLLDVIEPRLNESDSNLTGIIMFSRVTIYLIRKLLRMIQEQTSGAEEPRKGYIKELKDKVSDTHPLCDNTWQLRKTTNALIENVQAELDQLRKGFNQALNEAFYALEKRQEELRTMIESLEENDV